MKSSNVDKRKMVTNYDELVKLRQSGNEITKAVKQAFEWARNSRLDKENKC
jgi:hypothetical protein